MCNIFPARVMADHLVFGRIAAAEPNPEPDAEPEPEPKFVGHGQIRDDDAGHGGDDAGHGQIRGPVLDVSGHGGDDAVQGQIRGPVLDVAGHGGDDAGQGQIRGPVPDVALLTRLSMAHSLNLYCNLSWSLQQWERRFGAFSTSHPWGCDFWTGMYGLLAEYRFPPDSITLARTAHFKLPENFSKQAAKNCPGLLNPPSGKIFPCFVWVARSDNGRMKHKVVCLWMLIMNSRGWLVDEGWISF